MSSILLCWLLGTSVLIIDDFALDLLTFLGAGAFTDEGMLEHFVCLHPAEVYAVHPLLQWEMRGWKILPGSSKPRGYAELNLFR
jgi:hypothetical protein